MKYVFVRAVNVGGRLIFIKMRDLKTVFESLLVETVETFIASGNVIFNAAKSVGRIAEKPLTPLVF